MAPEHKGLREMYEAFNARDIERACRECMRRSSGRMGWRGKMFMVKAAFASTGSASDR
jgi:hypothetical protein